MANPIESDMPDYIEATEIVKKHVVNGTASVAGLIWEIQQALSTARRERDQHKNVAEYLGNQKDAVVMQLVEVTQDRDRLRGALQRYEDKYGKLAD